MDLRRLRVGEWIAGISGTLLLISLFLPWWSLPGDWIGLGPAGPVEGPGLDGPGMVTDWTAWQIFGFADVLLTLLALLAILVFAIVARATAAGPGVAAETLVAPLAVVAAIVALVQVLSTPASLEVAPPLAQASTEPGAWLGLAATLGVLAGLLVGMRDERLSRDGAPTDATGVPVSAPPPVETLAGPPPA
jgi:hypothetical protein